MNHSNDIFIIEISRYETVYLIYFKFKFIYFKFKN